MEFYPWHIIFLLSISSIKKARDHELLLTPKHLNKNTRFQYFMPKKKEETMPISEHERIKKTLHEEILRKDKLIEKLKKENEMLLKTALKRADALEEAQKNMRKIKK